MSWRLLGKGSDVKTGPVQHLRPKLFCGIAGSLSCIHWGDLPPSVPTAWGADRRRQSCCTRVHGDYGDCTGLNVDVSESAAAAMAKVEARFTAGAPPYDIFVVDMDMGGLHPINEMDGWQTLDHIQRVCPQGTRPSFVALSTWGREQLVQRSPQEQALLKAYLVKPFTSAMLVQAVTGVSNGLPALRSAPRATLDKPKVEKPKPLQGLHLLVVEDNLLNQVFARELLVGAGARVVIAENGAKGVAAVADGKHPPFDLALLDMLMPVMDGCTAARAIRNLSGPQQHVPIIAMTANAMESDREKCLDAGMNDHVGKPFDFAYLVQTILRYTK